MYNNNRMDHSGILERLCRVCGRLLVTKSVKSKYLCKDFCDQLHTVFEIEAKSDHPCIHPTHFCHACKVVVQKYTKHSYQHRTSIFKEWCTHQEGSCCVCQHYSTFHTGGRPKKVKRTPGRPSMISIKCCIDRVREIAPPPLKQLEDQSHICRAHLHLPLAELSCPICKDVLNQPIQLVTCRSIVCAECMCDWLQHQDQLTCPCCYTDHLKDFNTLQQAPSLVVSSIGSLCVVCGQCHNHMKLTTYGDHYGAHLQL